MTLPPGVSEQGTCVHEHLDPVVLVQDMTLRVTGFITPKYLNSPKTPVFRKGGELYRLYEARKNKLNKLLLVKGRKSWWNEPPRGKSAKQAKAIYDD